MKQEWSLIDNGKTLNTLGSEGGKIVQDEENSFGARVTLESEGDVAPASITVGIYGVLMHTNFYNSIEVGKSKINSFKKVIEEIIIHQSQIDNQRDKEWESLNDHLIDQLLSL